MTKEATRIERDTFGQRTAKAEIALLVTQALPRGTEVFNPNAAFASDFSRWVAG